MEEKLNELEADVKKFLDANIGTEAEAVAWLTLGLIDLQREQLKK